MRRLPLVILMVGLLVVMVTGCTRAPRYDSRLVAADSLMHDAPDSALAIIDAVSLDSLATEADHAYRDLLITQARYKCYIVATTDSGINHALAYYQRHSGEREKLTRAYIYKGTVMEELGHPDSAMLYYKHAEATADPTDYFNLGYANLRIAILYQTFYVNDSAVVVRMKNANRCFIATGDTEYQIYSLGTQGCFPKIIGQDSARICLEKAIELGKKVNSPYRFFYQSKLAGLYFYDRNYKIAKNLAMNVFWEGRELCDENQFYYYAARSYIHLGHIDSARWMINMIPAPVYAVDSMNYFKTMAELSFATHNYEDYGRFNEIAVNIDTRLLKEAICSEMPQTELKWDSQQYEQELKWKSRRNMVLVFLLFLIPSAIISIVVYFLIKRQVINYQLELGLAREELEQMLGDFKESVTMYETNQEKLKQELAKKSQELVAVNQKNRDLESLQADVSRQVSTIVRYRHAALNELYQNIRVKSKTPQGRRRIIPLMSMIKELQQEKEILHTPPKETFWKNLKLSVDGEFQGIASFVEKHYPHLTVKDHHLFLLMCAGVSNQIIKMCMNYTNDVTASKHKKKLLTEKMNIEVKLEDYMQLYLQGKIE